LPRVRVRPVVSGETRLPYRTEADLLIRLSVIWPLRCRLRSVRFGNQGILGSTQTRKRTPEMAATALSDPGFRARPRRERPRISGVCHRLEHQRRGCSGRRAPLITPLLARYARDPQRTSGRHGLSPQGCPNAAGADGASHARGRVSHAGPEVRSSSASLQLQSDTAPKET